MNSSTDLGLSKHAYLIIAHDNFEVLSALVASLDHPRNAIYIHLDRRAKGLDNDLLRKACKKSSLFFAPSTKVHWGHYSQIRTVLTLLGEATKTPHSYYHLLSGSDLPIKPQSYIHNFFEEHRGTEFVGFSENPFLKRNKYFYLFNIYRRPANSFEKVLGFAAGLTATALTSMQRALFVNRLRRLKHDIKRGVDWFSITHELALYILERRKDIRRLFRFSDHPNESYVQTIVWNSSFRNRVYEPADERKSSLRLFDWSRGTPYVYRAIDLPELLESDQLFARKFRADIDIDVVRKVYEAVSGKWETSEFPSLESSGEDASV